MLMPNTPTETAANRRRRRSDRRRGAPNVRRADPQADALLRELAGLIREDQAQSFRTGDVVNQLVQTHGRQVKQLAAEIGGSPGRLSEVRRTAAAFAPDERLPGVAFHFFTISARTAGKLGLMPSEVLRKIVDRRISSVRLATRFLSGELRAKANAETLASAALLVARHGQLIDRCHHEDFRLVIDRVADGAVKLIIADAPYGQYGKLQDGRHTATASTRRHCDAIRDADARAANIDLLRLARPKLASGGCLILFRPGAHMDPAWLTAAIDEHGWVCDRALTWNKRRIQLGRGDEPYNIASERLLVLCRGGDTLVSHDGGDRSDVLDIAPTRPTYETGQDHHQFEKPAELCRFLISRHTYEGELVLEPFGGSGPVSVAAAQLNRHWIYCDSNAGSFELGSMNIAKACGESLNAG